MLENAKQEFFNYVKNFPQIDGVILKKMHTMRVMKYGGIIAESLDMSEKDIELAKLCCLLHDIGRFEQWIRYNTFVDRKSVNHALLGYELLQNKSFRRKFYADESLDEIVLCAVKNHSALDIPDDISERQKLFLQITRDADKLDIIYMGYKELESMWNVMAIQDDSILSEEALTAFREHRLVIRSKIKTSLDDMACIFSFVYDLNFPISYAILDKQGTHLDSIKMVINKCNNPVAKRQLAWVLEQVDSFVSEQACKLSNSQKENFQLKKT